MPLNLTAGDATRGHRSTGSFNFDPSRCRVFHGLILLSFQFLNRNHAVKLTADLSLLDRT